MAIRKIRVATREKQVHGLVVFRVRKMVFARTDILARPKAVFALTFGCLFPPGASRTSGSSTWTDTCHTLDVELQACH